MRKGLVSLIVGLVLPVIAAAQQHLPTWYDRPENARDVVTKQVGIISESTQGVVTIYGADWCGSCNKQKEKIEKTHLDKKLAEEGIVIRYVRNQYTDNDKSKHRINTHLEMYSAWVRETLGGIPSIVLDDLGRSSDRDKREMAAFRLRNVSVEALENYCERLILDKEVSLLTEQERIKALEAIGSSRFNVSFGPLYSGEPKVGFLFTPKDRNDPATRELTERLHGVGNAYLLLDSAVGKYNPQPLHQIMHIPTQEQLADIRVQPEHTSDFNTEMKFLREELAKQNPYLN